MKIVGLTNRQFEDFARTHPLNNYMQTHKYALVMADYGYDYDFIGYEDDSGNLVAASLILTKNVVGQTKYGYAPKGFLVNYYDERIIREFMKDIREYYRKQDFVFIKFNPEIIIGQTNKDSKYVMSYNGNVRIIDILKELNVKRRKELKEFDYIEPKFNAYINLKTFDIKKINRNYRKKIRKCINSGLSLTLGDAKQVEILYPFLKTKRPASYYKAFYNVYAKDNSIDLLFVKLDTEKRLTFIQRNYEKEQMMNDEYNASIQQSPNPKYLNLKMASDKRLESYKENIIRATQDLKEGREIIIAGALVVKHYNRVSIIASGYNEKYKYLNPNHFLHYAIIERYKPYFSFCDMNGVSGNFEDSSQYKGLNDFKLKWNPTIYEFVGEFDLICSQRIFNKLINTSFIEDEFTQHLDHL